MGKGRGGTQEGHSSRFFSSEWSLLFANPYHITEQLVVLKNKRMKGKRKLYSHIGLVHKTILPKLFLDHFRTPDLEDIRKGLENMAQCASLKLSAPELGSSLK